jgi:hypothetical protein
LNEEEIYKHCAPSTLIQLLKTLRDGSPHINYDETEAIKNEGMGEEINRN